MFVRSATLLIFKNGAAATGLFSKSLTYRQAAGDRSGQRDTGYCQ
jgi:hypothetical protein